MCVPTITAGDVQSSDASAPSRPSIGIGRRPPRWRVALAASVCGAARVCWPTGPSLWRAARSVCRRRWRPHDPLHPPSCSSRAPQVVHALLASVLSSSSSRAPGRNGSGAGAGTGGAGGGGAGGGGAGGAGGACCAGVQAQLAAAGAPSPAGPAAAAAAAASGAGAGAVTSGAAAGACAAALAGAA